MKMKHIAAAALAVASVAPAFGAILNVNDAGGQSEIFLVVYGSGTAGNVDASYALDLGVLENTFASNPSSLSTPVTLGGTNWDSFLATVAPASLKWAVMGGDNIGIPAGSRNLVSTVLAGSEAAAATLTSSGLTSALAQMQTYISYLNTTGTHTTLANGDSFNKLGGPDYFLAAGGNTLNNQLTFDNSNLVGTAASVMNLVRTTGDNPVGSSTITSLNLGLVGGSYQLSAVTAAVPEPGGIALALTALGMLGFVGRRRNQD